MSDKEKSENGTEVVPTTTTTTNGTQKMITTTTTTTNGTQKMTRYERFVKAITPEKEFLPLKLTWYWSTSCSNI
jgi:hypothetical protein